MDFIEINGAGMRYDVTGDGPRTVVLLHEMCGSIEAYDELVPMILAGRRIVRYDWRGAGMSERVSGTLSMETLTDDLFALLDALGVRGKVVVCGMAVGGAVALSAAARDPSRVAAAVVMSPSTHIPPERRAATLQRADDIERGGMRPQAASLESVYPTVLRADEAKFKRYFARWIGTDPQSYAAAYRMLVNLDMRDALAGIKCPVLVLAGEADFVRPHAMCKAVADQIPGAQLRTTPGGHVMAMQTPREVADAMLEFLTPLDL